MFLLLLPVVSKAQNGVYEVPTEQQADSVRLLLQHAPDDTLKMSIFFDLSSYYTEINKDSALKYADQQLVLAKKLKQKIWEADALFQTCYVSFGMGNYPKSLNAVTEGLNIAEDEESEKNTWHVRKFSGDGDPHKARLYLLSALNQQLAFLYENTGNTSKAISCYLKSMKIAEPLDNMIELSLCNMSLGEIYMGLNKLDSALLIENKALAYSIQSNYKIYRGYILQQIGQIYLLKKNYDTAKEFFTESLQVNQLQYNLRDEVGAYILLANLSLTTHQSDSGLYYAKKALATAQLFGGPFGKQQAYTTLFSAFKSLGNTDSAYIYLQLAKSLGDSLNDVERDKLNQFQNLSFNEQVRLQGIEKSKIQFQNRVRTYALGAGIGILMLIAFLLFRNNRQKQKANALLKHEKEKVESTLSELKATQTQLIQSEKMASLGELTAGIAHEIQNPLNFVNNFSEVNKELLVEMKLEIKKGNIDEVNAIADDVIGNEEKINHHGKRADAIVKGMLQHSQSSTGQKEPTDINALADEYFRLAYHGLKAKDKSFNATMKTDFDVTIGNINIIPQDIGRVLLNLYNNAFYAISEKKKQHPEGYEPTVSVSTKKINDRVEIRVKDNGNGIPQKVVDKIFQPFFTTKPTGQGTGLGLSLSYDIIKAHGGEIKVDANEGEFAEFVIQLPITV